MSASKIILKIKDDTRPAVAFPNIGSTPRLIVGGISIGRAVNASTNSLCSIVMPVYPGQYVTCRALGVTTALC